MQETATAHVEMIDAGVLQFGIDYRHFEGDEGVAIHVYGEADGKRAYLLRFDCFRQAPHYHYGPEGKDERLFLDMTTEGDPLDWAIDRLSSRIVPMIIRAGHPEIARKVDLDLLQERLALVEGWAEALQHGQGKLG